MPVNPATKYPPEYYESGELPNYKDVARRYSSSGTVPAHESLLADILRVKDEAVTKYNEHHDPQTGEFTSGDGGGGATSSASKPMTHLEQLEFNRKEKERLAAERTASMASDPRGQWEDTPTRSKAPGRPAINYKAGSVRDKMKAAIDAMPHEHAALIENVPLTSVDTYLGLQGGAQGDVEGLFDYAQGAGKITIAQNIVLGKTSHGVINGKVKDTEGVTVHELAHALDYNAPAGRWALSRQHASTLYADAEKMKAGERQKADYFIRGGTKELFAEAYRLVYSPQVKASATYFGGLKKARAEVIFADSIAAIKAMKV